MAASLMTHRDVRSLAGALAVAHAVRRLAAGDARDPSFLFRLAADVARDEDRIAADIRRRRHLARPARRSLSRAIAHVESLLDLPRERALAALVEEANRHGAEPVCKRATMGFPPACIPTCLYLLLTTDSFEEALIEVVNLGGDADTAGAILGALAGAHYGARRDPRPLARRAPEPRGDRRPRPGPGPSLRRRDSTSPTWSTPSTSSAAREGACRESLAGPLPERRRPRRQPPALIGPIAARPARHARDARTTERPQAISRALTAPSTADPSPTVLDLGKLERRRTRRDGIERDRRGAASGVSSELGGPTRLRETAER